ncbi:DUF1801 domain-containing protein [Catalinimonas alkaloidigena]|uniref:DUF1801 domain-containing protein n=1 Tax=Catalinimonas alkaloidigena TaxID=1075417 RepID=UPI000B7EBB2D|nr:DUF1801 domain-containing protein [Catalinimonas alkaloidigena]
MSGLNLEVTEFLDTLHHPLRKEIELLREIILEAGSSLSENIKWNGPNYSVDDQDRITMRVHPPKQLQLIFHCGAKKQEQPKERIIQTDSNLITWKENDRAVVTFKNMFEIKNGKTDLSSIVNLWLLKTT